jgi:hypothetical protein
LIFIKETVSFLICRKLCKIANNNKKKTWAEELGHSITGYISKSWLIKTLARSVTGNPAWRMCQYSPLTYRFNVTPIQTLAGYFGSN